MLTNSENPKIGLFLPHRYVPFDRIKAFPQHMYKTYPDRFPPSSPSPIPFRISTTTNCSANKSKSFFVDDILSPSFGRTRELGRTKLGQTKLGQPKLGQEKLGQICSVAPPSRGVVYEKRIDDASKLSRVYGGEVIGGENRQIFVEAFRGGSNNDSVVDCGAHNNGDQRINNSNRFINNGVQNINNINHRISNSVQNINNSYRNIMPKSNFHDDAFIKNRKRHFSGDKESETQQKLPRLFVNCEGANAIDCLKRLSASIGDDRSIPIDSPPLDLKRQKTADLNDAKTTNYRYDSRSRSSCSAHSSISSNETSPISNNYAIRSSLSPPSKYNCSYASRKINNSSEISKNSLNVNKKSDNGTSLLDDPINDVSRSSSTPVTSKSSEQSKFWPAWVYCTRYSDRPSSGPRSRKPKKGDYKSSSGNNLDSNRPTTPTPDDKRPRTAFNSFQLSALRKEFESCQYLTEERRNQLASNLGLQEYQVKIWFQNKRAKLKKTRGVRNRLAIELMAQGLYNHSTTEKDPYNHSTTDKDPYNHSTTDKDPYNHSTSEKDQNSS